MKQLIIALIGLLTLSGCQVSLAQSKNSIDRCIEKWQDKPGVKKEVVINRSPDTGKIRSQIISVASRKPEFQREMLKAFESEKASFQSVSEQKSNSEGKDAVRRTNITLSKQNKSDEESTLVYVLDIRNDRTDVTSILNYGGRNKKATVIRGKRIHRIVHRGNSLIFTDSTGTGNVFIAENIRGKKLNLMLSDSYNTRLSDLNSAQFQKLTKEEMADLQKKMEALQTRFKSSSFGRKDMKINGLSVKDLDKVLDIRNVDEWRVMKTPDGKKIYRKQA